MSNYVIIAYNNHLSSAKESVRINKLTKSKTGDRGMTSVASKEDANPAKPSLLTEKHSLGHVIFMGQHFLYKHGIDDGENCTCYDNQNIVKNLPPCARARHGQLCAASASGHHCTCSGSLISLFQIPVSCSMKQYLLLWCVYAVLPCPQ